jgi:hypothetical protein
MEGFHGHEERIRYGITGHSGDTPSVPLVLPAHPPVNAKHRLAVLRRMVAHSQYCLYVCSFAVGYILDVCVTRSGDYTLEAARQAIDALVQEDADEKWAIIVSDANLQRYGIHPRAVRRAIVFILCVDFFLLQLNAVLFRQPSVQAHAIFIASIDDEAHRFVLPSRTTIQTHNQL